MQHDQQYPKHPENTPRPEPAGGKALATVAVWATVLLGGGLIASLILAGIVSLWRVIL